MSGNSNREAIVQHVMWNWPATSTPPTRLEVESMLDWRRALIADVMTAYPTLSAAEALEMLLAFGS